MDDQQNDQLILTSAQSHIAELVTMARRFCFCFLSLLLCQPALAQQIFRWVDSAGVVHFSERAPEGVDAVEVYVSDSAAVVAVPNDDDDEDPVLGEEGALALAPGERECRAALHRWEVLRRGTATGRPSDGTNPELVAGLDLAEALTRARREVEELCGALPDEDATR